MAVGEARMNVPALTAYSLGRPVCRKCRVERVYALMPAPRLDLCEPCYWEWQDEVKAGKEVVRIEHKEKRKAFRSKWVSRGSGSN